MRNLLTNEEKKAVRREYCWRLLSLVSGTILVTACIGLISLAPSYVLSRSRYTAVMNKSAAAGQDSTSKKIELAKATLSSVAAKENYVASTLSAVNPTEVIDAIVAEKGTAIILEGFAFRSRTASAASQPGADGGTQGETMKQIPIAFEGLSINGIARDRSSLTSFAKRLETLPLVQSVDVPVSNFEKGRGIDFSVILTLKRPASSQ